MVLLLVLAAVSLGIVWLHSSNQLDLPWSKETNNLILDALCTLGAIGLIGALLLILPQR